VWNSSPSGKTSRRGHSALDNANPTNFPPFQSFWNGSPKAAA
jgi:hypothetical protein